MGIGGSPASKMSPCELVQAATVQILTCGTYEPKVRFGAVLIMAKVHNAILWSKERWDQEVEVSVKNLRYSMSLRCPDRRMFGADCLRAIQSGLQV